MNTIPFQSLKKADPADNSPRHKALVRQTQKWVAQSFYGTLLKQMRDDPFRSTLMDGGRGGQAFGDLFDQHLAERMSSSIAPGLVRSIVHKIEGRHAAAQYQQQSKLTGKPVHPEPDPSKNQSPINEASLRKLAREGPASAASIARFHVTAPR